MDSKICFDYYYGRESSQYHYYQIPQMLLKDSYFKRVSLGAKVLYSIMLNRMRLSQKRDWLDDSGRVYIYFPITEILGELNCCKETAVKFLAELDGEKGIGLIERIRQGQGKPDKIYVKHFARAAPHSEADFADFDVSDTRPPEVWKVDQQRSEKPTSGSMNARPQEVCYPDPPHYSNKYLEIFTDKSYPINQSEVELIEQIRSEVKEKIEYDILCEQHDEKAVYGICELIVEVLAQSSGEIVIAKSRRSIETVKQRFRQLRREHVEYVLFCLSKTTTQINNIWSYLLAALFHAPTTIESYYTAQVNHDLCRKGD